MRQWLRGNVPIVLISLITGAFSYVLKTYVHPSFPIFFSLLFNGVMFVAVWYVCIMLMKPPIEVELRRFQDSAVALIFKKDAAG